MYAKHFRVSARNQNHTDTPAGMRHACQTRLRLEFRARWDSARDMRLCVRASSLVLYDDVNPQYIGDNGAVTAGCKNG